MRFGDPACPGCGRAERSAVRACSAGKSGCRRLPPEATPGQSDPVVPAGCSNCRPRSAQPRLLGGQLCWGALRPLRSRSAS